MSNAERWALALVVVLALPVVSSSVATAQPSGKAGAEAKNQAEKFFRAGERAYKAGQYLIAAQAFEEALKSFPVPAIVFSTAQAYRLQYFVDKDPGWLKRSIELYRVYVGKVSSGGRRDDATASLAELEPILQRIVAEKAGPIRTRAFIPATQILVNTQISGATASIDGKQGEVPLVRKVTPGRHVVRVEADGYFSAEQSVIAVEGRLLPVEIELEPRPARIKLRTNGDQISIDGRAYQLRDGGIELTAGRHFISVRRRGHRAFVREVVVERGQTVDVDASLETTTQRRIAWWVVGGAGAVYALSGLALLSALGADSDAAGLNSKRTTEGLTTAELLEYEDLKDQRQTGVRVGLAFAGIGTAVAVTGALMLVFDNPTTESPMMSSASDRQAARRKPLSVSPLVGPDLAGLVAVGRF